jgi:hypothetical protein
MIRHIRLTVTALAAIACLATAAQAMEHASMPNWGGSIYFFGHNAPVSGGTAPAALGIIGLGYEMTGRLGAGHWGWAVGGGYGIGGFKDKVTGSTTTSTDEISLTHYEIRLGFDYWDDCCDEDWYCGPGFVYESTTLTIKQTGFPDDKLKPYSVYGFDPRAGGAIKLGSSNMRLFGQMSMLLGYGSYKQTGTLAELKQTGWFVEPSWRGGLRFVY